MRFAEILSPISNKLQRGYLVYPDTLKNTPLICEITINPELQKGVYELLAVTRTSNRQVAETLSSISDYISAYTGEEVDAAVRASNAMQSFLNDNVIVAAAAFTGDYLTSRITMLTRAMWLDSVVLYCKQAFSASYKEISYEIALGTGATIVSIPNDFMVDEGNTLVYHPNRLLPANSIINMVCSSTKAFGEVTVKLNFT